MTDMMLFTVLMCVCSFFNIPIHILPKICTSSEIYGHLNDTVLAGVPISGVRKSMYHFNLSWNKFTRSSNALEYW